MSGWEGGRIWWSGRFVDALESGAETGRLERGRGYAATGAVRDLRVGPGEVLAKVQGSRPRPYRVSLMLPVLDDDQWATVTAALAGQPLFRAKLLSGELPPETERVFGVLGLALFPRGLDDLVLTCSCPDWGHPCKHAAATLYVLADSLDGDPFLLLTWLGRERGAFLSALRRHGRAAPGGTPTGDVAPPVRVQPDTGADAPATGEADGSAGADAPEEAAARFWSAAPLPAPPLSRALPVIGTVDAPAARSGASTCGPDPVEALTPLYARLVDPEAGAAAP
ncbi:putative Zn finger protein [Spinactinospora alkalitolerans]|uniref:Putative Zn finger protein n=1 Tax=Spinactinospora alkalitolerans TaxID=687207 RepID=A0A852TUP2_9ACTN|nr:SWIM zinc finger family protein [Spinactinospora alkalitolerans]NYE47658.1 putative Zn finger protein [Spinactinospora alkalitolerans]